MNRAKNGLGLALVIIIVILLTIKLMEFPAAGSEQPQPQWVWDEQGRVTDATGQYIRLTDEEACEMYGLCRRTVKAQAESTEEGADATDGGGCR